jgi:acetolactate synthase I/II/III large subunit
VKTATVGEIYAGALVRAGVEQVFAFPGGGSNLDLIEAFAARHIETVLPHTETAAAFLACGQAEFLCRSGVVMVGNGPGLASVANGAAQAFLDRTPLLIIADRYTEAEIGTSGHQVLDQRALLDAVVKESWTVDPDQARFQIDRAIDVAMTPPRGPVLLDMPRDAAGQPADDEHQPPLPNADTTPVGSDNRARVGAVVERLRGARRPVVIVGLEAPWCLADGMVERLAEALQAPVLTTYKAKGCYPESGPWWAGIVTNGAIERAVLDQADVVLSIGLDPVELLTRPWPPSGDLIDLRESTVGLGHLGGTIELVGNLAGVICRCAGLAGGASTWRPTEVAELRASWQRRLRVAAAAGSLSSWEIVEAAARSLPPDTPVSVDAGAHMFAMTSFWPAASPRRFLISNGLATMGYAIPAALGIALAQPGQHAVAFTGDGGAAYHLHELETAARHGAHMTTVVFNDASLSLIRIKQEAKRFFDRPLNFSETSFSAMASALGAYGVEVEDGDSLGAELVAASRRPGPSLIDVRLRGDEYGEMVRRIRG